MFSYKVCKSKHFQHRPIGLKSVVVYGGMPCPQGRYPMPKAQCPMPNGDAMSTKKARSACVSASRSRGLALAQEPVAHVMSIASIPSISSISSTPSALRPEPNHSLPELIHFRPEPSHFRPEPNHLQPKPNHFQPKSNHFAILLRVYMNARPKKYFSLKGPRPAEPETLLARKTPRNNRYKSERKCNEDGTNRKESGKKVERNRKESGKKPAIFKDLADWGIGERTIHPAPPTIHKPET